MTPEKSEKPIGKAETPEGEVDVLSLFRTVRDDREVTILQLADGTIGIITESWLRQNDHKKITTTYRYSESTFAIMLQTMLLGCEYIGLDARKLMQDIATGDRVNYEFAGNGEFELRSLDGDEPKEE